MIHEKRTNRFNKIIRDLRRAANNRDWEQAHRDADWSLREAFEVAARHGASQEEIDEVLLAFEQVSKWYA